jgi:hypothetical protein
MSFMIATDGDGDRVFRKLIVGVVSAMDSASVSSHLWCFGVAWRNARHLLVEGPLDELAAATAASDIATVGRLLRSRDVNRDAELPLNSLWEWDLNWAVDLF